MKLCVDHGKVVEERRENLKHRWDLGSTLRLGAGALSVPMKPPKHRYLGADSGMHVHLIYEGKVVQNRRLPDMWEVVVIIQA